MSKMMNGGHISKMMRRVFDFFIVLSSLANLGGGRSFVIQPRFWDFKGHDINYEVSRRVVQPATNGTEPVFNDDDLESEPILLLNGFGVGSFHQHRLIAQLFEKSDNDRIVYSIDYLGQGQSWPRNCDDGNSDNELGLVYSAEMWVDQLIKFIEEVILPKHAESNNGPQKVHVVGNSVGGHMAAHLANKRPDLVESVCLLNPTPVWGLNLPGWSGQLPAPAIPKAVGRYLFDRIRDLNTIEKYLEAAYSRKEAYGIDLMHQIRGCTLGAGGHAAFASILWSPPLKVSEHEKGDFQECLSRLRCDVLLMFGKDDPWCKPAFAKKMLRALGSRNEPDVVQRYIEVENCGHCPNHEAPQAVANAVVAWVDQPHRSREALKLVNSERDVFHEPWGETAIVETEEHEISLSMMDRLATTFV